MSQNTPPIAHILRRIAQLSSELSEESPEQAANLSKATNLIADDLVGDADMTGPDNAIGAGEPASVGPSAVDPLSSQGMGATLDEDDFAGLDPDVITVFTEAERTGDLDGALSHFIDRIAEEAGVSPAEAQHPTEEQMAKILDIARQKIEGVQ